ncbi:acyl-CoA synthetase [Micrococcus flavus]|uniref:O-succinylbenzoic acid--CoA ligase n=2 Tax=Micrococcus flavus TaxID=384602 RepID=A0A4Y8X170_9MICC|nr:AMP-binding protein [Micrococcus flavus]MBB4882069.1 O-succinylbenzoic acid--CoA ligase [Micrococcus flavus]TFI02826.1 acyl-CoA synthetase [Micrococcus flavus]GGK47176.1 O-succinylbenzoic acid--CoA ligase [Micrococcus flavus]
MPLTPDALATARSALATAFDGGAPVEFTADGTVALRPEARDPRRCGDTDAVAVVRTSGSTGTPKQIVLTGTALRASAAATARRLGGEGAWLLALGVHYVAGLAVLSRSIAAGTAPVALPPGPFTPAAFATGAAALPDDAGPRLVSLVPTQLARLLAADADPAGRAALRSFDRVLVGGARLDPALRDAAEAAGVRLTATYGMAETCGGCVYDGVPLPGVAVAVAPDDPDAPPRVRLAGPMVAAGYLDDPARTAEHFVPAADGARAFLTEDTGVLSPTDDGVRLTVTGRLDDVVITGGVKVSAAAVTAVLEAHPGVAAAHVAGVPDPEWGARLCAAVVPAHPAAAPDEAVLRAHVREALGAAAVPKTWLVLDALPLLSTGKTDRQALTARFTAG